MIWHSTSVDRRSSSLRDVLFFPLILILISLVPVRVAIATEWQFVGARYQGMGGAGVAVVDDSLALYWNPGALGFAIGRDIQVPFGASVSAEGNVMSEIDSLDALARDLADIVDKVGNGDPLT